MAFIFPPLRKKHTKEQITGRRRVSGWWCVCGACVVVWGGGGLRPACSCVFLYAFGSGAPGPPLAPELTCTCLHTCLSSPTHSPLLQGPSSRGPPPGAPLEPQHRLLTLILFSLIITVNCQRLASLASVNYLSLSLVNKSSLFLNSGLLRIYQLRSVGHELLSHEDLFFLR